MEDVEMPEAVLREPVKNNRLIICLINPSGYGHEYYAGSIFTMTDRNNRLGGLETTILQPS